MDNSVLSFKCFPRSCLTFTKIHIVGLTRQILELPPHTHILIRPHHTSHLKIHSFSTSWKVWNCKCDVHYIAHIKTQLINKDSKRSLKVSSISISLSQHQPYTSCSPWVLFKTSILKTINPQIVINENFKHFTILNSWRELQY